MKRKTLVSTIILTLFIYNLIHAATVSPTYDFSTVYKNSKFYSNLMSINITGNQQTDIVNVALSQYGYTEGDYNGDFGGASNGSSNYTEYQRMPGITSGQGIATDAGWCAAFVSWCARQAGIPTSVLGNSTTSNIANFGLTKTNNAQVGSLAFIQFDSDVNVDHTALVYDVDDTYVYTIEGNRGNKVDKRKYYKSSGEQVGYSATYIEFYGNPSYIKDSTPPDIEAPTFEGSVDICEGGEESVFLRGWTFYTEDTSKSIEVHAYIGGPSDDPNAEGHVITANTSRSDVNNVYGCGEYHGFESTIKTNKTGTQDVYIYAVNGNVHALLEIMTVTISETIIAEQTPTYTNISIERSMFTNTENITFSYTSDHATEYYLYISNTSDWSIIAKGSDLGDCFSTTASFTISSLPAGNYAAYVTGKNSIGHKDSQTIYFKVYETKPTTVEITVDKSVAQIGETLTFSYNSDSAEEYFIWISNTADWSVVVKGSNIGDYYSPTPNFSISNLPVGTYYAYVTGRNQLGHTDSAGIIIKIYDTKPNSATLSIDKSIVLIGEKLTFFYDSDCAEEYFIWISDTTDWSVVAKGSNLGEIYSSALDFSIDTLPAGTYRAYVTARNRLGHIDSDGITFKIYDTKPNNVTIEADKTVINTGDTISFSFNSDYAEEYYIHIIDTTDWTVVAKGSAIGDYYSPTASYEISSLPVGKYRAYVTGKNTLGHLDSEQIAFVVTKNIPYTETQIKTTATSHNITSELYNIASGATVIIASYKGNVMKDVKICPYDGESINTQLNGDFDEIKVMVWRDFITMQPLCEPEVIPSNEFIIE